MISLSEEKELKLSSQQVYDIISKAMEMADDEGFINAFVFDRAIHIVELAVLDEEKRDAIADALEIQSPMEVWDDLLADGSIDVLVNDYPTETDYIEKAAEVWYEDYTTYCASPRGMIGSLDGLMTGFTNNMNEQVAALQGDNKINEALKVAEDWGMNRELDESLLVNDSQDSSVIEGLF